MSNMFVWLSDLYLGLGIIWLFTLNWVIILVFMKFKKYIFMPNIINVLIFPIILFLSVLVTSFYFITTFFKISKIIKNQPNWDLLTKFDSISNKYAENEYYKIRI